MDKFIVNLDFDKTIKCLTTIIALFIAIKAIIEYRRAQKWKKSEFLAKEIKEFLSDKDVRRALLILDWNVIDLPLYESEIPENKHRSFLFDDEIHLKNALSIIPDSRFTDEESIVRKTIDEFLVRLSMIQNYVDSKLINTNDLKPYLKYWIKLMGDKEKSRKKVEYTAKLWAFILHFEYDQVIRLMENFDYKIK